MKAGHKKRPPHPGEAERIAERRERALTLRKQGLTFREIARQLGVSADTAFADVSAEIGALRSQTMQHAQDVLVLELERCDEMQAGLWPSVRKGDAKAVLAAVRVGERRARLLGLDAATKTETKAEITATGFDAAAVQKKLDRLSDEQLREVKALQEQIRQLAKRQDEILEA